MHKHFTVDARTVLTLGRDSIKDHTTALIELVKNSYDADAGIVEVEVFSASNPEKNYIRIADDGCGMSEKNVDERWLRIGYSEKLENRLTSTKHRRKTGEKGIGRLSADRLGALLTLHTKTRGHAPVGLAINWEDFNISGCNLATIPVHTIPDPPIRLPQPRWKSDSADSKARSPAQPGTELIAKQLRHNWTADDVSNLHDELSILTPPFTAVQDFEIRLKTDVLPELNGPVQSPFVGNATIELQGEFDGQETISFAVTQRDERGEKTKPQPGSIKWAQLVQRANHSKQPENTNPACGSVRITLMFFPRKPQTARDTQFSLTDLKDFLDRNAGVRIYRDNIRVKPYGDPGQPEGDWLKLAARKAQDPAGAARKSFKVAPGQLVGAVFVGRDKNPSLIDSSSREGLIHGRALNDLKALVLGCVALLEASYHDSFAQQKSIDTQETSVAEDVKSLGSELQNLATGLREAKQKIPRASERKVDKALDQINSALAMIVATKKSIDKMASQATIYRGLATIGISATVFGHETQSSISQFVSSAQTAKLLLQQTPPSMTEALEELEKAHTYAERVATWGAFALARVKRDKRRRKNIELKSLVERIIVEIKPVLEASGISVSTTLEQIAHRAFGMDLEAILINLLTNAYAACQQGKRQRRISVALKEKQSGGTKGFELVVSDSGPGVAGEFVNRIWEPLFSTRVDAAGNSIGTGLGLSIVHSIVDEFKGAKAVDRDPDLKGARFRIWLPLN